ncbi:MAG: DUF2914 domain-containing protein [Polyangiaceae bacterium]
MNRATLLLPTLAILLAACGDPSKPAGATSASVSATTSAPARSAAPPAPPKPVEKPADGVELQKFVLTSDVKNKAPVDALDAAKPGQRVYAHVTVRNRTDGPKRVSLSFRVNDDERSMTDLTIEKSWSYRSWAYVTLRKTDKGELTVHVFDDHGAELGTEKIPIQ